MDQTDAYLEMLFAAARDDVWIEMRSRTSTDDMRAEFFSGCQLERTAARVRELGSRTDVYVGCVPRRSPSGRREAVASTRVLWVDCDTADAADAARLWSPAPT